MPNLESGPVLLDPKIRRGRTTTAIHLQLRARRSGVGLAVGHYRARGAPRFGPAREANFACDGIHFSRFLDITPAGDAGAGRTFHQPVDGFIEEGGMVYAYIQENVLGLSMDRYDDDPNYPTAPPRVVRYGTTLLELERRAIVETRGLAGC